MKKANRSNYRYTNDGKSFSSYREFSKAVRKSQHINHNWKVTTGWFSGILLKPIGGRRSKQYSKANHWDDLYWERIEAERANARWGGELC